MELFLKILSWVVGLVVAFIVAKFIVNKVSKEQEDDICSCEDPEQCKEDMMFIVPLPPVATQVSTKAPKKAKVTRKPVSKKKTK